MKDWNIIKHHISFKNLLNYIIIKFMYNIYNIMNIIKYFCIKIYYLYMEL